MQVIPSSKCGSTTATIALMGLLVRPPRRSVRKTPPARVDPRQGHGSVVGRVPSQVQLDSQWAIDVDDRNADEVEARVVGDHRDEEGRCGEGLGHLRLAAFQRGWHGRYPSGGVPDGLGCDTRQHRLVDSYRWRHRVW